MPLDFSSFVVPYVLICQDRMDDFILHSLLTQFPLSLPDLAPAWSAERLATEKPTSPAVDGSGDVILVIRLAPLLSVAQIQKAGLWDTFLRDLIVLQERNTQTKS